jgi:aspartyl-tRNA(Asn)/glutamyl-tRNA(Gln) amidotransferase subunit A
VDLPDLHRLSALELIASYKRGDVSPVEVTESILDRIEELNPRLNVYVTVTADLARKHAREAEKVYAEDVTPAPLAGVPGSLKDLTSTKGIRTAKGSLLHKDWIPDYDAPLAERLFKAGWSCLGRPTPLNWDGKGTRTTASLDPRTIPGNMAKRRVDPAAELRRRSHPA